MKTVYAHDAWGRRKLKDWQYMPTMMRIGFFAVDSALAIKVWHYCRIAILMVVAYFGLHYFNPFDGVVPKYVEDALPIALTILGLIFLLIGEFVLRAITSIWYEKWRTQSAQNRT